MLRKSLSLFILFLLGFLPEVFSSHYMGGEIIWECLPNGNYRFIMRVYRECGSTVTFSDPETLNTNAPCGAITMHLWPNAMAGKTDMSPVCNSNPTFPHVSCATTVGTSNAGGVEEWLYTTDQSYPNGVNITGVPPATGWYFSWTGCCRNPCTNITGSSSLDWFLRAIMYPYNGQNVYPCWDNSPVFIEKPTTVICTGYPFKYNPNATDKELDSLSYEWAQPLTAANSPITTYAANYSYNNPLPGPAFNPNNVPATINPYTGELSFTSFTQGAFVTVSKVTAYRCGIKIAEVFREMQVVLLNCGNNYPPEVTSPFINPVTGLYTEYIDTVFAGSVVTFGMSAQDFDFLNNGTDNQWLTIQATGNQFGQFYTNTNFGCLTPPCATLDPAPPQPPGFMFTQTNFSWQTTCAHLQTNTGCGGLTNVYNFIIKVLDDYCPAPAINVSTITVVVKNAVMVPPTPRCTEVLENGDVVLSWGMPDTTVIPNTFNAYMFYMANNINGPYTLVDSIFDFYTTSHTITGANAQSGSKYFYMVTRSGCYGLYYSGNSDTIRTIDLNAQNNNGIAHLTWNAPHVPPLSTTLPYYYVYRQSLSGNWVLLDSTQNLQLDKEVTGCGYIKFRVAIEDSLGCQTISSVDSALFQSAAPATAHCISVNPDGALTIDYLAPADSISENYFSAYLYYSSTNPNGPFALIDSSFTYESGAHTIGALNGNNQSHYVYIINRIECDGYFKSDPTDTLKSIFLTVTPSDPTVNQLTWNPIHMPDLPTSTHLYTVYRNYPAGWTKIKETMSLSVFDTIFLCGDSIAYRIEMNDLSGCRSVSNVRKGYYFDNIPPAVPTLDTVGIDTLTGYVNMSWLASGPETFAYLIFYNNNGIWDILDTVYGNTSTSYTDMTTPGDACDGSKSYAMAAADSCWNTSSMGLNNVHNTIHLQIDRVDPCADVVDISWTAYHNMKDYLGGYHIYVSENGSPYTLLASVLPPGAGLDPPTQYTHQGLTKDTYYCYVVKAFNHDQSKTSTSCSACVYVTKPSPPDFTYLRNVSVVNDDHVHLKMFVDTAALVQQYKLFRADEKTGPYQLIAEITPTGLPEMEYDDYTTAVTNQSFYYYFSVIDSCGTEVMHSDTSRTIYLDVQSKNNFTNVLSWNDYEGWTWSFVKAYNIFRGIDGVMDPIPIATVPFGTLVYTDEVGMYTPTQGKFRYYIEAQQGPGFPDFGDTSFSNYASDVQNSMIFIPNAFSPKGYNSVFRPVSVFVDRSTYVFVIWNRWGEELFRTTDPSEGWDGRYKDEYVPVGTYIYYVKFITSEGEVFEKRSAVTVIK